MPPKLNISSKFDIIPISVNFQRKKFLIFPPLASNKDRFLYSDFLEINATRKKNEIIINTDFNEIDKLQFQQILKQWKSFENEDSDSVMNKTSRPNVRRFSNMQSVRDAIALHNHITSTMVSLPLKGYHALTTQTFRDLLPDNLHLESPELSILPRNTNSKEAKKTVPRLSTSSKSISTTPNLFGLKASVTLRQEPGRILPELPQIFGENGAYNSNISLPSQTGITKIPFSKLQSVHLFTPKQQVQVSQNTRKRHFDELNVTLKLMNKKVKYDRFYSPLELPEKLILPIANDETDAGANFRAECETNKVLATRLSKLYLDLRENLRNAPNKNDEEMIIIESDNLLRLFKLNFSSLLESVGSMNGHNFIYSQNAKDLRDTLDDLFNAINHFKEPSKPNLRYLIKDWPRFLNEVRQLQGQELIKDNDPSKFNVAIKKSAGAIENLRSELESASTLGLDLASSRVKKYHSDIEKTAQMFETERQRLLKDLKSLEEYLNTLEEIDDTSRLNLKTQRGESLIFLSQLSLWDNETTTFEQTSAHSRDGLKSSVLGDLTKAIDTTNADIAANPEREKEFLKQELKTRNEVLNNAAAVILAQKNGILRNLKAEALSIKEQQNFSSANHVFKPLKEGILAMENELQEMLSYHDMLKMNARSATKQRENQEKELNNIRAERESLVEEIIALQNNLASFANLLIPPKVLSEDDLLNLITKTKASSPEHLITQIESQSESIFQLRRDLQNNYAAEGSYQKQDQSRSYLKVEMFQRAHSKILQLVEELLIIPPILVHPAIIELLREEFYIKQLILESKRLLYLLANSRTSDRNAIDNLIETNAALSNSIMEEIPCARLINHEEAQSRTKELKRPNIESADAEPSVPIKRPRLAEDDSAGDNNKDSIETSIDKTEPTSIENPDNNVGEEESEGRGGNDARKQQNLIIRAGHSPAFCYQNNKGQIICKEIQNLTETTHEASKMPLLNDDNPLPSLLKPAFDESQRHTSYTRRPVDENTRNERKKIEQHFDVPEDKPKLPATKQRDLAREKELQKRNEAAIQRKLIAGKEDLKIPKAPYLWRTGEENYLQSSNKIPPRNKDALLNKFQPTSRKLAKAYYNNLRKIYDSITWPCKSWPCTLRLHERYHNYTTKDTAGQEALKFLALIFETVDSLERNKEVRSIDPKLQDHLLTDMYLHPLLTNRVLYLAENFPLTHSYKDFVDQVKKYNEIWKKDQSKYPYTPSDNDFWRKALKMAEPQGVDQILQTPEQMFTENELEQIKDGYELEMELWSNARRATLRQRIKLYHIKEMIVKNRKKGGNIRSWDRIIVDKFLTLYDKLVTAALDNPREEGEIFTVDEMEAIEKATKTLKDNQVQNTIPPDEDLKEFHTLKNMIIKRFADEIATKRKKTDYDEKAEEFVRLVNTFPTFEEAHHKLFSDKEIDDLKETVNDPNFIKPENREKSERFVVAVRTKFQMSNKRNTTEATRKQLIDLIGTLEDKLKKSKTNVVTTYLNNQDRDNVERWYNALVKWFKDSVKNDYPIEILRPNNRRRLHELQMTAKEKGLNDEQEYMIHYITEALRKEPIWTVPYLYKEDEYPYLQRLILDQRYYDWLSLDERKKIYKVVKEALLKPQVPRDLSYRQYNLLQKIREKLQKEFPDDANEPWPEDSLVSKEVIKELTEYYERLNNWSKTDRKTAFPKLNGRPFEETLRRVQYLHQNENDNKLRAKDRIMLNHLLNLLTLLSAVPTEQEKKSVVTQEEINWYKRILDEPGYYRTLDLPFKEEHLTEIYNKLSRAVVGVNITQNDYNTLIYLKDKYQEDMPEVRTGHNTMLLTSAEHEQFPKILALLEYWWHDPRSREFPRHTVNHAFRERIFEIVRKATPQNISFHDDGIVGAIFDILRHSHTILQDPLHGQLYSANSYSFFKKIADADIDSTPEVLEGYSPQQIKELLHNVRKKLSKAKVNANVNQEQLDILTAASAKLQHLVKEAEFQKKQAVLTSDLNHYWKTLEQLRDWHEGRRSAPLTPIERIRLYDQLIARLPELKPGVNIISTDLTMIETLIESLKYSIMEDKWRELHKPILSKSRLRQWDRLVKDYELYEAQKRALPPQLPGSLENFMNEVFFVRSKMTPENSTPQMQDVIEKLWRHVENYKMSETLKKQNLFKKRDYENFQRVYQAILQWRADPTKPLPLDVIGRADLLNELNQKLKIAVPGRNITFQTLASIQNLQEQLNQIVINDRLAVQRKLAAENNLFAELISRDEITRYRRLLKEYKDWLSGLKPLPYSETERALDLSDLNDIIKHMTPKNLPNRDEQQVITDLQKIIIEAMKVDKENQKNKILPSQVNMRRQIINSWRNMWLELENKKLNGALIPKEEELRTKLKPLVDKNFAWNDKNSKQTANHVYEKQLYNDIQKVVTEVYGKNVVDAPIKGTSGSTKPSTEPPATETPAPELTDEAESEFESNPDAHANAPENNASSASTE